MVDYHITKPSCRYHPYSVTGISLDPRKNRRESMNQVLPDQIVSNLFTSIEQPQAFMHPFTNFDDDGQSNNYGNSFELQDDQIGFLQSEQLCDIPEMMSIPFIPAGNYSQISDIEPFGLFEMSSQASDIGPFVSVENYSQGSDVDQFLNLFGPHFFFDHNDALSQQSSNPDLNVPYAENTNLLFLNESYHNYKSQSSCDITIVPPPIGTIVPPPIGPIVPPPIGPIVPPPIGPIVPSSVGSIVPPSIRSTTQNHPLNPVILKLFDKIWAIWQIE
ncbi:669_t:CDS:1 [Cetraspora pellucida]|uniref:669_t:CDS:1 n=1 Tax=Cetraspora pellucida TaxID=1433469 RepID=A0A9N9JTT1_9GLOM|nr:669_t:CDS:1 [Cetraspora pellucida]